MLKKFLLLVAIFTSLFLLSTAPSFAVSCGDGGTVNNCGSFGGCASNEICVRGLLPWTGSCEASNKCENADNSVSHCGAIFSNYKCGVQNGCAEGYMCFNDHTSSGSCVKPTADADPVSCKPKDTTNPPPADPPANQPPSNNSGCVAGDPMTANRCGSRGGCTNPGDMCVSGSCIASQACANTQEPTVPTTGCGSNNTVGRCNAGGQCPDGQQCRLGGETGYRCIDAAECKAAPGPGGDGNPNPPAGGGGDTGNQGGSGNNGSTDTPKQPDIFAGPNSTDFNNLNPLRTFGGHVEELSSPGGIVSRLLVFAFPLAGLILFVMIVWGGFEMITGATSKGIEAGRQRVTAAVVGFILLFVAYWIFQIVEVIFGIQIL